MKVITKYAILEYIRPKSISESTRQEEEEIAQIENVIYFVKYSPLDKNREDPKIIDWLTSRGVKIKWLDDIQDETVTKKSNWYKEIFSARKRAVSMGRHHGWRHEFNKHPLAASLDNHTVCIDAEMELKKPDYLSILVWLHNMATSINRYCDENRISGNAAAEYWLERFLWRCDTVCKFELLN